MDRILINDLSLRCIIGVNNNERREKQDVVINLSIYADLGKAGKSDRFEDTVDYRAIKKRIVEMVEGSSYFLVEALAEAVAKVCLENVSVNEVTVRVDKPSALRYARTVGVEITRRNVNAARAFVSVGSNIDPGENVRKAIGLLGKYARIKGISTVYLTEPLGGLKQPGYYNCVVEIETRMAPRELKYSILRRVENELGRARTADKFAPRSIDLDLILYDGLVLEEKGLRLPAPEILNRPFLAVTLAEIAPGLKLPDTRLSIEEVVSKISCEGMVPLVDYTGILRKEIRP